MRLFQRFLLTFLAVLGSVPLASAQNIDMSTLPTRDSVQLTIYNSEDLTLVREKRMITVRKGVTELQFSWANTLIDASSVSIRLPDARLELVDTRYPHDRPQALYWLVRSEYDGEATVEISYFTSGITWSADYEGVVNPAETSMRFDGFVSITNNSGEDYENASVRMVVGTINLVETIRDLASRGILSDREAEAANDLRSLRDAPADMKMRFAGAAFDNASMKSEAEGIVKEGLSEYFIFTVPGEETVRNGWSKRMRLFHQEPGTSVPFSIEYRYRPQEYGDQLVRLFLVRNDTASKLGESPLPDGMVRLYREQAQGGADAGGLSVLAFVNTKYVPIGQEFEFNLGRDPQVILERLVLSQAREDFWFQTQDPNRLVSPTKGERIDPSYGIAGWNDRAKRVERIRNYRGSDVKVAWRFGLDGDLTFRPGLGSGLSPTLFDFRTPEFSATVKAGETRDLGYEVTVRQGSNATQNAVKLEATK